METGDKVRVLDNAFGNSTDPADIAARGKIGVVVWVEDDGRIEVQTEDDDFLLLLISEVELIEAPADAGEGER